MDKLYWTPDLLLKWIYPFELDKLYFTSRTTNLQNLIELNFTETHLNPDFSP